MNHSVILYSYFRSSAAYRVRIALHLKKIPFEYCGVHLLKNGGMQHSAEYRSLNPMGEVPCLIHNGQTIGQSLAILQYLDDVWPTPSVFPTQPFEKARVLQFCENINSSIHPYQNLKLLQKIEHLTPFSAAGKEEWCRDWIMRGFEGLEKLLEKTSGTYCFGGTITAADLCLIPQVFNARRFHVDMDRFPQIKNVDANCKSHPAFVAAHPMNQPDTET